MRARFDDLAAGVGRRFGAPRAVLVADTAADVPAVLAQAERACADGAWAYGYVGYEAAPAFDPALRVRASRPGDPPLAWFALTGPPETGAAIDPPVQNPAGDWIADWDAEGFGARVESIRAAIAAGSVYQCNLTTRLRGRIEDPAAWYAALAHAQGGRYHALLDIGSHVIASASPELFFEWTDEGVLTRPMKGTAPRAGDTGEDERRRAQLLASGKELAENVMIVDLLRNDLARIARTGSVRVPRLLTAERYRTVWQLTSDVTAVPTAGTTLADVFGALFPSGSVTGAPKAAAMRHIAELEDAPRGVYCGAIGMLAPPGGPFRARFSVAIRTLVVRCDGGAAVFGTGGGITWGSAPAAEHAEALLKAAVLTRHAEPVRLLETMRHEPGRGTANLRRHLDRLAASAREFGFGYDERAVRDRLDAALAGAAGARRVRLLLGADGEVTVEHRPLVDDPGPVRLALDPLPNPPADRWSRHKTTRRARYDAAAARCPDADDVVLVDAAGEVVETTRANLAARIDGCWYTPPCRSGALPGVERGRLVAAGVLRERTLTVPDLDRADALAVISSLRGWRPAVLSPAAGMIPGCSRIG